MAGSSLTTASKRAGAPSKEIRCSPMQSLVLRKDDYGLPILKRDLTTTEQQTLLERLREIEFALNSTPTPSDVDRARAIISAAMPAYGMSDGDAAVEALVWDMALTDAEMVGKIPGWVIESTTREYIAGKFGKWRPRATEFAEACRKHVAKWRAAAVEHRRMLDAKVEKTVQRASPERVQELLKKFESGLPKAESD